LRKRERKIIDENLENNMKSSVSQKLSEYYKRFDAGHDFQRERMLAELPDAGYEGDAGSYKMVSPMRITYNRWRTAIAVAAVFVILFSVVFMQSTGPGGSQTAWAKTVEIVSQVKSVHFIFSTPDSTPGSSSSSAEIWWQRSGDFRVEYSNGLVVTGSNGKRYSLSEGKELKIQDNAAEECPEIFLLGALGELGQALMTDPQDFSRMNAVGSKVIKSEDIVYKGEKCRKILSQKDDLLFEYVVDRNGSVIYEVKQYLKSDPQKVASHAVVLDIDRTMPDSLFVIDTASAAK